MFLKKIELKGFKSFADRTVIDFSEGITCIVGPNGSGKSNVTDAFRWVLGEQRFKTLRGSQMQDVIFNGTGRRKALGFAEVAITFDNETGFLPVDYNEVTVVRRLYRSGESDYAINNNKCRLKDVKHIFMDTGVGVEGYSIIGQGRIDSILSTNKDERRLIFEEAAGIVKYRTRKDEAGRKLARTLQNLARIEDIVSELEQRVGPLKQQSEKAKKYQLLAEELKSLEINLFINEIDGVDEKLNALIQELHDRELVNNDKKTQLESLLDAQVEFDNQMVQKQDEYRGLLDNQQSQQRRAMKLESDLAILKERRVLIESNLEKLLNSQEEFGEKSDELKRICENYQHTASQKNEECVKQQRERDLEQETVDLLIEKRLILKLQKDDLIGKKEALRASIQSLTIDINRLYANENAVLDRLKDLDQEVSHYSEAQSRAISGLSAAQQKVNAEEDKYKELIQEQSGYQSEIKSRQQAILQAEEDLYKQKTSLAEKKAKRDSLLSQEEKQEGFAFAVKQVLDWSKEDSDVLGCIKDIFTVEKKFETAVETALGRNLQNIVVMHEDAVDEYIDRLKSERAGRATFMPLAQLEPRPVPDLEQYGGFYGCAMHHLKCENTVRPALQYILSNVYFADGLNDAKKVARSLPKGSRVVTLDGEVVNVGGAVTGGSLSKKETGFLKRKREIVELGQAIEAIEAELSTTEKNRDKALLTIAEVRDALENLNRSIEGQRESVLLANNQLDGYREAIAKAGQSKDKMSGEHEQLTEKSTELALEIKRLKAEAETKKASALQCEDELKAIEVSSDELSQTIETSQQKLTEIRIATARLEEEVISARGAYEEKLSQLEMLEKSYQRQQSEENSLKEQLAIMIRGIEDGTQAVENERNTTLSSEEALQICQSNIEGLRISLQGVSLQIENLRNVVSSQNDDLFKLEIEKTKLETRKDNIIQNLWDKYELSYIHALDHKHDFDQKAYAQSARRLKSEIKELGEVNLTAINEYDLVSERYEFLSEQKKDLKDSSDQLNKLIREMDKQMRASFKDKLDEINGYFKETFSNLFGGGFGEITTDQEEDILAAEIVINAQPPGKKLQGLELMSGGEKALTAIALLFAILKTKPSPFCILDEIEAALDDVNIFRFAEFLKEFVKNSQFIIITHRKGTMEIAESLYGVTMQEQGISTILSVKLDDANSKFIS
ncbi:MULTISPECIES: chromosome segregation protein SMC [unclassified Fusibacter]|uniref:chromosome segregation protein SMC n=1 Tax=unclassified Fusibacter TaxID=2624464 RepID=UPI001012612E|nr:MULTISPECIES: chromosome segregation protein SMC [unclassified Fusibacter]MCK8058087.1 chromosome segregation protein SMC [Fusibacter sp. A2]NPE20669.1 chromosome segregation protein SMC [Fusibacter sp. A1]RXV62875.1 chromosome segregation protein SMC [Fusibacter sp. A1]